MKVFLGNEVLVEFEIQNEFLSPAVEGQGEIVYVLWASCRRAFKGRLNLPFGPAVIEHGLDLISSGEVQVWQLTQFY